MSFGSVNTPGAWLVEVKNQLKEMLEKIENVEQAMGGLTAADVGARPSTWKSYHAGTSAPSDTTQLWIDTTASNPGLKYWNGSDWVNVPVYGF